ncbi:hypothetical protein [Stenotrophomonas indicatrix]|uniref:hypothetical protein n=1 Tax=Stenotrophomonas indicatrix TaxID=2045451 RepID=UPI0015A65883|nr:hypothetical protein [Stenotrophomonas indicatrix]
MNMVVSGEGVELGCNGRAEGLVDPRHAWMDPHRNRIFRQFVEEHPRMAWIYRVDQGRHPPKAGHATPPSHGMPAVAFAVALD